MQVIYIFADGTKSVVEVDQEVYNTLEKMNKDDFNTNRKETRRHVSLDALDPDERYIAVDDPEYLKGLEHMELWHRISDAIDQLDHADAFMLTDHYIGGKSMTKIAEEEGVSVAAISKRLKKSLRKIAIILDENG